MWNALSWLLLTSLGLCQAFVSQKRHGSILRDFMYVLPYSLAFGFVRVSSGPAKAVAEPATSKVARVKKCMILC